MFIEFDADPLRRFGITHYDEIVEYEEQVSTHYTALCVDGIHLNRRFATPFEALDWAVMHPNCDSKNHVFFRCDK